jgi:hypothetical protein
MSFWTLPNILSLMTNFVLIQIQMNQEMRPVNGPSTSHRTVSTAAEEDGRPHQRQLNYQSLAYDRAISRVMQHVCGVLALQGGFETSSIGALTKFSDMALQRKS